MSITHTRPISSLRGYGSYSTRSSGGAKLTLPMVEREVNEQYFMIRDYMQDHKVINGLAECCIKDVQEYAHSTKDIAYREDILVLVAKDHYGADILVLVVTDHGASSRT